MDLRRIQLQRIDQVLLRHAEVRVRMIRRHAALVAPPQLDRGPTARRRAPRSTSTSNSFFGVEPPDSAT